MATSRAVAVLAMTALWACGPSSNQPKALVSSQGLAEAELIFGEHPHPMPLFGGPKSETLPLAHLNYYGGVVLSNVAVVVVFWGPNVEAQTRSRIGGFYSAVTNSPYMDWLSEYNTTITAQDGGPGSNQLIGRGTLAATVTITPSRTGTTLQDTEIQAELNSQISGGFLPAPTANTVYMTYFPFGIRIIMGGSESCAPGGFCAYHGTFRRSGSSTFYGVMPDMSPGSGCYTGCGNGSSYFDNLTSVSSHELIETVTDADVGLATVIGRPLAWYDPTNGEIGDICNADQGLIGSFVVQKEWSNVSRACIVSRTVSDDFSISLNPTSQSTPPGSTTSYTVNTAIISGSAQTINLSISGLPASISGSFNPATITAGGSSTLTLTVSGGALPATYNFSVTGTGTSATHSTPGSVIVTGSGGGGLVNGDFETGDLTGWTPSGTAMVVGTNPHTGSFSAQVGSTSPSGDSSITQTFDLPATAFSLSFFYQVVCPDSVFYDWATATLQDNITSTVVTLLPPTCTSTRRWVQVIADVSAMAGHNVTLTLSNHDDNFPGDPTYTFYDDIVVNTGVGSPLVNGDFETGDLSSWLLSGIGSISTVPHSGSYSAQLGNTSPSTDSTLSQTFDVPPTAFTLSLWYQVHCPDTITYDWATVTLRDNVTSSIITVLPGTCTNNGVWVQATANIASMAGHSATLTLINHDDNYPGDATYTLYDDVMVQ